MERHMGGTAPGMRNDLRNSDAIRLAGHQDPVQQIHDLGRQLSLHATQADSSVPTRVMVLIEQVHDSRRPSHL